MTARITKVLLPVLSIVLLAPFVIGAVVALFVALFSLLVEPVSLSFRFYGGQASTSFLSLPRPLTAVAILIGSAIILCLVFRSRR